MDPTRPLNAGESQFTFGANLPKVHTTSRSSFPPASTSTPPLITVAINSVRDNLSHLRTVSEEEIVLEERTLSGTIIDYTSVPGTPTVIGKTPGMPTTPIGKT